MADNQSGKKKTRKKGRIKDGVVLKVSDIEKECDRLRRRPRAALYPLLPITEPLKLKRKSIHLHKGRRRHRKHCRKRLQGIKRRPIVGHTSRSRLITSESTTTCSRNPLGALQQHNQQHKGTTLYKPHWGSASDLFFGDDPACSINAVTPLEHPRHHHYHGTRKPKHRICHHDPLICGHRTSVTTSLRDLRELAHLRRHRRRLDPEAGLGDKDSTASNSRSRKIVSVIVASVASFILMMCVALVAVTLRLTPAIDELGESIISHVHHTCALFLPTCNTI